MLASDTDALQNSRSALNEVYETIADKAIERRGPKKLVYHTGEI
jgi:hypothetical protein